MSCSCLRGVSRWFTPSACGPGHPELSKSCMDMARNLFTFTFTCGYSLACRILAGSAVAWFCLLSRIVNMYGSMHVYTWALRLRPVLAKQSAPWWGAPLRFALCRRLKAHLCGHGAEGSAYRRRQQGMCYDADLAVPVSTR